MTDDTVEPIFHHLHISVPEPLFITRLWLSLQASGHLMTQEQVRACLLIVDASFAPKQVEPHSN